MRKSRRIASFLTLLSSKIDIKKLRVSSKIASFLICQVRKLRKSRRLASFLSAKGRWKDNNEIDRQVET